MSKSAWDVADWMIDQFDSAGVLDQQVAAYGIKDRFGDEFIYMNENGNLAIDRRVLRAFRKLTGDEVVWSGAERAWRRRETWDEPGRAGG